MCLGWRQKSESPPSPRLQLQQAEDLSTADASRYQHTPTSGSPQQTEQLEQLLPVAAGLPSQVDETLEACPRFRILLAGKSGIGKSSLIKFIFNLDRDEVDIAHHRAGIADIDRAYTSPANPRFILHDSKGFEAGSDGNWATVETFLDNRRKLDLPERIHALWFCIETPLEGSRLLQRGDEKLLKLAERFRIPIIVVFLKYDGLVTQSFVNHEAKSWMDNYIDAKKKASESFDRIVRELKKELRTNLAESIPCVKVSTPKFTEKDPGPPRSLDPADITELLINLTKVTRERLQDVEVKLRFLWDAAQQVNALLKVESSISEGFKKYWLDLGRSSAFEGQILIDCIHRLHDDVVKVWNFNDPTKILSSTDFFIRMIGLVKPLIDSKVETLSSPSYVQDFGSSGAKMLVPLLQKIGLNNSHVKYLYDKYQRYPSTAKLLSTYIINLILILYGIFSDILPSDPPRSLSNEVVSKVLTHHEDALKTNTLVDGIDSDPEFPNHPETVIANVIRERLPKDTSLIL